MLNIYSQDGMQMEYYFHIYWLFPSGRYIKETVTNKSFIDNMLHPKLVLKTYCSDCHLVGKYFKLKQFQHFAGNRLQQAYCHIFVAYIYPKYQNRIEQKKWTENGDVWKMMLDYFACT